MIVKEFPTKGWKLRALNNLRENWDQWPGSRRHRSARMASNINIVNDLVLSQWDAPQSHRTTHQIHRETGISKTCVIHIIHNDLQLGLLTGRNFSGLLEFLGTVHKTKTGLSGQHIVWKKLTSLSAFVALWTLCVYSIQVLRFRKVQSAR